MLAIFSHWSACTWVSTELFAFDEDAPSWRRHHVAIGTIDESPEQAYLLALYFSSAYARAQPAAACSRHPSHGGTRAPWRLRGAAHPNPRQHMPSVAVRC